MTDSPSGRRWGTALDAAVAPSEEQVHFVVAHDSLSQATVTVRVPTPSPEPAPAPTRPEVAPPVQLVLVPDLPDRGGSGEARPVEATGMNGTIAFDGHSVTITEEDGFAEGLRPLSSVSIALESIRGLTLEPATRSTRGYLRVDPTYGSAPWISFKLRQQAPFDALRDAVEQARRTGRPPSD